MNKPQRTTIRVTAGTARGRRLVVPAGGTTRPTPSRVREAILNFLHSRGAVTGTRVLDLYAGTGSLGIEALSRGAAEAVFVEDHPDAASALRANLAATGLAERAKIMSMDADAALGQLRDAGHVFDVAMADPPYAFDRWDDLLARTPAALVVIQSDRPISTGCGWEIRRRKRYGNTVVTLVSARTTREPLGDGIRHSGSRQ